MVKKDRAVIVNKLYLLKMLPPLYQTHLENQLNSSELLLLNLMINILQDIKNISLEKIATVLPIPILFESRRKKIQRFLSLPIFSIEALWFTVIKNWLSQNLSTNQTIYLVIDRTIWQRNNLIMISMIYERRAIPIYWELLAKLGSSNLTEQISLIAKVLDLFKDYQLVVLADREFCSVKLATWLQEQEVEFCLRLKKNEFISSENTKGTQLNELGLKPGISWFIEDVKVTKTPRIGGFNVVGKWQRKICGVAPKEGWFILTNLTSKEAAIAAYRKRFGIEEMFRDFKSGGYNLEDTNVTGKRLISLILLIAIAYSSATFKGQAIKHKGVQSYVGRVQEYGRIQRRHSSFYIGFHGESWVNFRETYVVLVTELMRFTRNKLECYLRGQRAIEHILSTF